MGVHDMPDDRDFANTESVDDVLAGMLISLLSRPDVQKTIIQIIRKSAAARGVRCPAVNP